MGKVLQFERGDRPVISAYDVEKYRRFIMPYNVRNAKARRRRPKD